MLLFGLFENCRRQTRLAARAAVWVLASSLPIAAQTGTLTADTAVTSTHPATNYGTLSNLYVSSTSTTLLRFDLGALPATANASDVTRATLRLFVNRVNTPGVITVSSIGASWNESAVTAQTLPVTGNAIEVFPVTDEGQYVTVDVTSLVQAWLTAPVKNFGLALSASAADAVFDSKENDTTAHPAQLDIALSSGAAGPIGPVGLQGPKGDTGAAGAQGLAGPQGQGGNTGPQGIQGPKGDTGDPGTGSGLQFEGIYSASTSYAKNNVVSYANTAWVSLQDANYNNTPSSASTTWSVLVPAPTSTGTGTGTTTLTANGLAYAGVYSSSTNYITNQVVTWQSAAWVSLHDANHGNTPDQSANDWAILVPASTNPASVTTLINGLLYQGAYASATNYAANYVVSWQNSAWVSLHATNHGNEPDQSVNDWAVLVPAAVGLTGATGLKGDTGATGPQGERGYTGIAGLQGDPGAIGAMGPPGFTYQGTYASATNYGLGDVVLWQGGSWASLHATNHGNTPDASPLDWGTLTTRGLTGDTGAMGAQGLIGLQGPAGQVGAAGQQGPTGPVGSAGPQGAAGRDGAQGVQGDVGPVGSQGVAGPVGLTWQGTYNSTTNYATNDAVTWQSQSWLSLHNTNHGNTPDASPADWALLAAQGGAGPQGSQGPQGYTGITGAAGAIGPQGAAGHDGLPGAQGATGPQGTQGQQGVAGQDGLRWQGAYNSATNYALNDGVGWQNQSWISLHDANHGNTPDASPADWTLLAAQGGTGPQGLQGSPGVTGLTGIAGATGPQGTAGHDGAPGTQGQQGFAGPQGLQGSQGLAGQDGLGWQGTYNSATNYAMNDGVGWQNQSWISLHDVNHGNAPDASPADWALLAAQGGAGPQGPQGLQGLQGITGDIGAQGLKGDTGVIGATGQTGSPGLQYQGNYASTANYALRDAVTYGGGTWISLQAANDGNPPDASPTWWQQIAAPGSTGPAGPLGVQGVAGPQGTSGAQGVAGPAGSQGPPVSFRGAWLATSTYAAGDAVFLNGSAYIANATVYGNPPGVSSAWSLLVQQGAAGVAGPQGVQGPQGQAGAIGSAGAQGASGTAGLTWRGTYNPQTGYSTGDAIAYSGASYVSLVNTNNGNTPGSTAQWTLLAAAGASGVNGTNGATGARGNDGAAATVQINSVTTAAPGTAASVQNVGTANAAVLNFTLPQGATGAAGTPGLTFQGTWVSGTGYAKNDVVYRSGSSYVSEVNTNTSDPVVSVANNTGDWKVFVSQGDPGPASVTIGTVTAGSTAAVTNSGTQNAAVLNFTLPRGATGLTGPAGLTYQGTWTASFAYSANDAVTYANGSYIARTASTSVQPTGVAGSATAWALLAAQGSAGATGATGLTGPTGAAPTITVLSTSTGAPGTNAAVTNSGTSTALQLSFVIPQGAAGTSGSGSGGGVFTTVHTVAPLNAGLNVYSPLVDGHNPADAFAVLAYLPATCKLSTVLVYNSSTADAKFEIHTGTPGNMTVTAAGTCTVKANSATTCTGPGTLGSNSFVSFGITSETTTTSYLYSQFFCS